MPLRDFHKSCEKPDARKTPKAVQVDARAKIVQLRRSGKKWREIGLAFPGVALGTLARIAYDDEYEPSDPDLRRRLGMPDGKKFVKVKAVFCDKCQHVHPQLKRCLSAHLRTRTGASGRRMTVGVWAGDYETWRALNLAEIEKIVEWAISPAPHPPA